MAKSKLTKASKDFIMRNKDLPLEELAENVGLTKPNKELKDFVESCKAIETPVEKSKGIKVLHGPAVLVPGTLAEEMNFHAVLPPPSDSIVKHEVKFAR